MKARPHSGTWQRYGRSPSKRKQNGDKVSDKETNDENGTSCHGGEGERKKIIIL